MALTAEHAATLKAKDKREPGSQQNSFEALERERQKLERTLGILSQQHATEMDILRRKSKREWQNVCDKLQEQLGRQHSQFDKLELQRFDPAQRIVGLERRSSREIPLHFVDGPFLFYDLHLYCFVLPSWFC